MYSIVETDYNHAGNNHLRVCKSISIRLRTLSCFSFLSLVDFKYCSDN